MGYYRKKKAAARKRTNLISRDYLICALCILVLSAIVIVIRGCIGALGQKPQKFSYDELVFDTTYMISVYDHKTHELEKLPLEEYIFHVVAAEMPAAYGIEALKAQAIAARTYALVRMEQYDGGNKRSCEYDKADICTDSSCCQSFKTVEELKKRWGNDFEFYAKKLYRAVTETEGLIAVYEDAPIDAMYHSSSGGMTENSENVYEASVPYLRAVESPGEEAASGYTEKQKFSYKEIAEKLNSRFDVSLTEENIKNNFYISKRYDSSRVEQVVVGSKKVSGQDIRHALSLKSSNFTIKFTESYVIIETTGYGHGLGMSQAGANAMSLNGSTYSDILLHYYTGIDIINIGEFI